MSEHLDPRHGYAGSAPVTPPVEHRSHPRAESAGAAMGKAVQAGLSQIGSGTTAIKSSKDVEPPTMNDLFDVYEPVPAQCKAVLVTDQNIHALAKFLRAAGDLEVQVVYDPDGATLLMKQESQTPPGGGPLLPGFAVSARTGELLVLYRDSSADRNPAMVLHEGWNTVSDTRQFSQGWRRVPRGR